MKIGICCYPTYGGSGAVATELGLKLADRGHEVHFISYAQPFRLERFRERVFFHEVEMEQYPLFEHSNYSLALSVAIHQTAVKWDLDLVHVHYAIPHATSAWVAREMLLPGRDLPIVTTLHGTDITLVGLQPSYHSITSFSILRSQGITAVSEFLRDETVRNFGVPRDRVRVIPNFIDVERYVRGREPCYRTTLAPGGEKIVMHVSNFRPVKRVNDVVDVFARIARSVRARLIMVGDGPERPRAAERAEELGIADQVLFLGKVTSVDELLSCADLFLLPSESESFGLAALEAMACGAPVVTSRAGGLPEVVVDGETGFTLDVGDVEGMADAGTRILTDNALWRRQSACAREIAVERFSAERVVPVYEDLYRDVLSRAGRPVPAEVSWVSAHVALGSADTVDALVRSALAEDIGPGDWSTAWTVDPATRAHARIVAKADVVVAGVEPAAAVFAAVDPSIRLAVVRGDGLPARRGEVVLELDGPAGSILTAERPALNFLAHLSGIATLTRAYVDAVAGTGVKVIDTRKTTPGWRALEKAAVRAGGGVNYRMGLYDMVMIKDNHIAAAGGITAAVGRVRAANAQGLQIVVEVGNMEELEEVLALGVDRVLLDNMNPAQLERAVERTHRLGADRPELEASGRVTLENIRAVAATGVDFISVGSITHSAPAADLSLQMDA